MLLHGASQAVAVLDRATLELGLGALGCACLRAAALERGARACMLVCEDLLAAFAGYALSSSCVRPEISDSLEAPMAVKARAGSPSALMFFYH